MYSSGYSQVSMRSPQTQKKMQYRSKGKGCGYYMRIVFFFSSLIQSLIIVSLVLFLIYGKKQDSASVSRVQDLEERFSRLSLENVVLRQQRRNLTTLLNSTLTEKARNDWDLALLRFHTNRSVVIIDDFRYKLKQCSEEMFRCRSTALLAGHCPQSSSGSCNCGLLLEQLKARLALVESNFTQTTQRMSREMDQMAKERDNLNLETIGLRRDKFTQEKEVEFCRTKCKEDFAQSLSGISNVTKAFLLKVDSLFPAHIAFQLTCPKQREHLEQIRTNCSSLSMDVEDKFQRYLNSVGEQVSRIQAESGRLKAENWRLSEDYRWCSQNRTGMIQQHRQSLEKRQRENDEDKERLLMDKMRLNGEIQVLSKNVKYKGKEAEHLREQLRQLNMSCVSRTGFSGLPGGSASRTATGNNGWGMFGGGGGGSSSASSSSTGGSPFGRTGSGFNFGSSGSALSRLGSTGAGSSSTSLSSAGSDSATGLGYNKPGSSGGSSSSSGSTGSSPNLSSSGTGYAKPATGGRGSSSYGSSSGSSSGSTGSSPNLSSSGTGSSKPTSSVRSYPSSGSSSGTSSGSSSGSSTGSSTGSSSSKSGSSSSGFSWLGFGNSNSGQSKTGSGTGKGTSSGSSSSSSSGTGSIFGGGRTSGLGGGSSSASVNQHLQDLQRLINPARPEDKRDISRLLG